MLHDETVLTFSEAAARLPRLNGKKIHASSLWRWARKGISGVRLETRRLGGRFVTSIEALDRFSRKLAEIDVADRGPAVFRKKTRTEKQRQRDTERAEKELTQQGN